MIRSIAVLLIFTPLTAFGQEDSGGATGSDAAAYGGGTFAPSPFAGEAGGEGGVEGGDFVPDMDVSPGLYGSEGGATPRIPKAHVVKEGETLWDICKYYYDDPWSWPQLWAANRSITNPHWIYPGDELKMIGYSKQPKASARRGPQTEVIRFAGGRVFRPDALRMQQKAFVDSDEYRKAGSIVGSKVARILLSEGDEVYVEGGTDFSVTAGEQYSVYKVDRPLKTLDGRVLGQVVEICGNVRIKNVNEHGVATGVILRSRRSMERGDLVGPLRQVFKRVPAVPAEQDLKAQIVDAFRRGELIGTDQLVFLDKGVKSGVQVGNRFLVARRGDGYRTVYQSRMKDDPRYPYESTAEILVVDVRDETSVGLVTRAEKEVRKDDFVRLRRGY